MDKIEPFHSPFSGAFSCCDHISWCWPQLLHKSKLVSCKFLLDRIRTFFSFSCRPSGLPFYVGLILPFLAIYVFNWTMFSIIMVSLCRHWTKLRQARQQGMAARDPPPPATKTGSDFTLRHVVNSAGLALILGLGWGFGLAASSNDISALACTLQFVFSVFVSCQGVLILLFHGVRSKDVRTVWASWLHWLSGKLGFSCCRQSTKVLVLNSEVIQNDRAIKV